MDSVWQLEGGVDTTRDVSLASGSRDVRPECRAVSRRIRIRHTHIGRERPGGYGQRTSEEGCGTNYSYVPYHTDSMADVTLFVTCNCAMLRALLGWEEHVDHRKEQAIPCFARGAFVAEV